MTDKISPKNNKLTKYLIYIALGLMHWLFMYNSLNVIAEWVSYKLLGLDPRTKLAQSVWFFLLDAPKVLLLLVLVVFGVGILRTFFSPERTRKILAGKSEFVGNILAALLGIATPFCSCSAVPLFIGFVTTGVPLGVTFSFLISAPMINEVALVLLFGLFGWKIAGLYLITGLIIAIISGWVIGRLKMEKYIESWVFETKFREGQIEIKLTATDRIHAGFLAVKDIVSKVWIYILIGIGIGAYIHGYVPEKFLASMMGNEAWWSVPLAVIIGVPLYSNAAGIIPIVQALLEKGASLGTVLAFMMAVIGLSLPETIILRKVLKLQLIATFILVVAFGILVVGYLFNFIDIGALQ